MMILKATTKAKEEKKQWKMMGMKMISQMKFSRTLKMMARTSWKTWRLTT